MSINALNERLAQRMEDEAPWKTCSSVLDHQGWLDMVETIQKVFPDAYAVMVWELTHPHVDP